MKRLYNKGIERTPVKEKIILRSQFLPSDILLVILATILCVIFVVTPVLNETVIRIGLGLLFILFLPGYSLIAALFPKKGDIGSIERAALSFGLSIAVTPLMGLLLNYTPFGIRLTPILLSLSIFTILMSFIAYIRRLNMHPHYRFNIRFKHHFDSMIGAFKRESGIDRLLSIILIISIIIAISMTTYAIAAPKQGEKFTEFYILGPDGKASGYPTNLTVGEKGNVLIGIVNHEYTKTDYHMVIQLNGKTIKDENITLSNNEKWENTFTFNPKQKGKNQKLEFILYKLPDNNNIYRSLHLWININ